MDGFHLIRQASSYPPHCKPVWMRAPAAKADGRVVRGVLNRCGCERRPKSWKLVWESVE